MGIRGLTQALKGLPVGTEVTLQGKSVVIDGPALVHRLWEVLMKDQHSADVILERVTYTELGECVIRWLDDLRSQDVHVYVVFLSRNLLLMVYHAKLPKEEDLLRWLFATVQMGYEKEEAHTANRQCAKSVKQTSNWSKACHRKTACPQSTRLGHH